MMHDHEREDESYGPIGAVIFRSDWDVEGEELHRLVRESGHDPERLDWDALDAVCTLNCGMTVNGQMIYLLVGAKGDYPQDAEAFDRIVCGAGLHRFLRKPIGDEYNGLIDGPDEALAVIAKKLDHWILVLEHEPGRRTTRKVKIEMGTWVGAERN